jgi:hypothetical protein
MPRLVPLLLLLSLAAPLRSAASVPNEKMRGSPVEWARLQTSGPYWDRHANSDPAVLVYLKRTTPLNLDSEWHAARASSLEELRHYPFIYSDNIANLSASEARNLAEYLRRGGFLFIDACRNKDINPDIPQFLEAQIKTLADQFPKLRVEVIAPQHELFSIYFKLTEFPPFRKRDGQYPLRAAFVGDRMVAVIGLNGFQCGWAGYGDAQNATACAQMAANIYVYAMTR